jgi:hypothetical protein
VSGWGRVGVGVGVFDVVGRGNNVGGAGIRSR